MKIPSSTLLTLSITCLILTSCIKWEETPTDGLLLYLNFDRNIDDHSGNSNDGIKTSENNYVDGRWDKALDFNGYSDVIELTNTINAANGLSFSFWIKTRGAYGTENNGAIVSKYNMTGHLRCFMVYSFGAYENRGDNRLMAAFYKQTYNSAVHDHIKSYFEEEDLSIFPDRTLWTIFKPKRLETGKWTHCVINITPTELQAWVNGELCATKRREHATYFDTPNVPTYIGNNMSGGEGSNNHYNGALDELRIFNRGLSKREIQILYKNK